ncbi:hypothetical protein D3C72_1822120 [compost metagenome]
MAALRSHSPCGRNGKTLVKWPPGLVMDLVIEVPPDTVVRSAMVRWPAKLAAPPITQKRPMRVLPDTAAQPAMTVWAPTRTLCAIWTWLSILQPSSTTVSAMAPRSIAVLAPTSTSWPSTARPVCGIFTYSTPVAPMSGAKPKPSAPITTPLCRMARAPTTQWW